MKPTKQAAALVLTVSILFSSAQPWAAAGPRASGGRRGGEGDGSRPGMLAMQALGTTPGAFSYPLRPQVDEVELEQPTAGDAAEELVLHPTPVPADPTAAPLSVLPASFMGNDRMQMAARIERVAQTSSGVQALGGAGVRGRSMDEIFGERPRLDSAALPGAQTGGETFKPSEAVPESVKVFMKEDLDLARAFLHANYAPGAKKAGQTLGWKINEIVDEAKRKVDATPGISLKEYWKIHKAVFDSTRDYHVASVYFSTEASVLPFTVKGAIDKKDGLMHYHIMFIDRAKLPRESFPFDEGDELVSFGGKATRDAVKELQDEMVANKEATDRALATLYLTLRRSARGMDAPTGPVDIVVRRKGGLATESRQVAWDYSPETIEYNLSQFRGLQTQGFGVRAREFMERLELDVQDMLSPVADAFVDSLTGKNYLEGNPHGLGNKESYLPKLGPIEQDLSTENFHAYIYKDAQGRKMGYVRIANYTPKDSDAALEEFDGIVAKLEANVEGLNIDQLNNPGGSVFYLYGLASMLTGQALSTPKHQIAINPQQVASAQKLLAAARMIKNDAQAKQILGPSFGGFPVSYQLVKFLEKYAMDLIDEWKQGHALTKPIHMYGVDKINPSTKAHFTKPIQIIVNELDFSGGDFFPFIMAMNGRAVLFGVETAGAGGFVLQVKYPNLLGIDAIHYTGSTTDVENSSGKITTRYEVTTDDLEGGFKPMADAINAAMNGALPPATAAPSATTPAEFQRAMADPAMSRRMTAPGGPANPFEVADFDLGHTLRLGGVSWNEDASGPADGMRGAIRVTFFDSKDNTLQLQMPEPGNSFGGDPVFKFIPPNLTESEEHRIKDYPITHANAREAVRFLTQLLFKVEDRGSTDPALTARVLREVLRRIGLIEQTQPEPESFPVEGGIMRGLLNIKAERARAVWTKVRAELSIPPFQHPRHRRIERPTAEQFAELRAKPRFVVRMDGGDQGAEVFVKDDHTAIYHELNPNPNWERFFEVPLD